LRRPWQRDVDATHRGKMNIYMFNWKGKIVAMRSILPALKFTKEKESKFISYAIEASFGWIQRKQNKDLL